MPYSTAKLFGLSVKDVRFSLGWNQQLSQMTVQLVQDAPGGDRPAPPPVGWPAYVELGAMGWWGLLQRWEKSESPDGMPAFEATLVDPREVLDGAQVVTGDYAGPTRGVPNLFNCFGHLEARGFGASGATAAGMPWAAVRASLLALANGAGTPYGGPLNYRGVAYGLDLSGLPSPPPFYRVPGPAVGLLDLVGQLCEDAACDYFVELVAFTIRVRAVSRALPPPLGTIAGVVSRAAAGGGTARASVGVEARNEPTSVFLVGGQKTSVYQTADVRSFWGYDLQARPILGGPVDHPDVGTVDGFTLNATGVADIVGSVSYRTNVVEVRCALHSFDAWERYLAKYRRDDIFPLVCGTNGRVDGAMAVAPDLRDDGPAAVAGAAADAKVARSLRLYNWLRALGESYYGRQFAVRLPFVLTKTDPETLKVTHTLEPADSGYLPAGAAALGLSALSQDVLQDADERVVPFAHWASTAGADLTRVNWADAAVENNKAWARAQVGPKVVFTGGPLSVPCVILTLGSVLYDAAADVHGDKDDRVFRADLLGPAAHEAFGTVGTTGIHPAARYPTSVGVPLRSTTEAYGPWFVAGAPGKVRFEADPSLTPWEYGGYQLMDAAANARVLSALSAAQVQESGAVALPGLPTHSPGDTLATGGPTLTNVDVQYGVGGVVTTYRFQAHTPRFGVFSRQNADRLRRLALTAVEFRQKLRRALVRQGKNAETAAEAFRGAAANAPLWAKKQSPHTVLLAEALAAGPATRVGVSTETYEAALVLSRPTEAGAANRAVMSWTGLLRPFTTRTGANPTRLPQYTAPTATGGGLTAADLDPFGAADHDVEVLTSRDDYQGMHAWRRGSDPAATRAVALRGPLVVAGWGRGTDGNAYPDGGSGSYPEGHLRRSDTWKVGPVDLLWDPKRAVWTSHDCVDGWTAAAIPAGGTGAVKVGNDPDWLLPVTNPWSRAVGAGVRVVASYMANRNAWYVTAADCPA